MKAKKIKIDLGSCAEELLVKILDHYPESDQITLKKVMSLGTVKFQEVLPGGQKVTAAVVNTKPYTLIYGKSFIEENLEDMDDLVYLTSHELTHLVLDHFAPDILQEFMDAKPPEAGDTKPKFNYTGLGQAAMHIVVDCQVNATVYNSLKEEKYLKFIKSYYSKTEMPYCFFRPDGEPSGEGLSKELTESLKTLHSKLYSESGVTNKELIEGLMPWFEKMQNKQDELQDVLEKLLGNHEDLLKNRTGNSNSEELEKLAEAVAQNYLNKEKQSAKGGGGGEEGKGDGGKGEGDDSEGGQQAGRGGDLREQMIEISLEKLEAAKCIRSKLNTFRVVSPSSRIYKAIDQYSPKTAVRSVVPNFHDRRTTALYSVGKMPVFHNTPRRGSKVKVPCYLDVSGSQDHVLPVMLPVVSRLKTLIGDVVYCFSTQLVETKITDLKQGKYFTDGGTDFNPVLEHIIKNKFRQAIILSDGRAYATKELIEKLNRMNVDVTIGWTEPNPQLEPLTSMASKTFYVFGEK